jgi:hypothetical protein
MYREQLVKKAIEALPNEDPKEVAAVINRDGTVDTYIFPFVPDWLSTSSKHLRLKVAEILEQDAKK